ncbi:hypothetical protein [Halodesulfovibrio marinisediminis]|uniref:Negative regulator of RcsB-dependent stress response n=1 Tax=Halodesulfovibrio marinisediminis DSM 17456 TaxID=1121457 RepID=A0A1N6DRS8_9BACT|nr:hypothetical protein [Halodesulfovibrio marinisediminis]SIN73505.1 hypothetical protein SAMN02745161_0432 [Halodesulfovibrio marinisediminis DSM 17456]
MTEQKEPHSPLLMDSLQQSVSKEAAPLLNFVLKHIKMIALGLFLLISAIAGAGIYSYMHEQSILVAQQQLMTLSQGASTEAKLNELRAFAEAAPEDIRPAALLALAKASLRIKDYVSAADAWGTLQNLGADSMRDLAGLGRADAYARMGDYKKAQEVLTQMLPTAAEAYKLPAKHQLAIMAEKSGDVETSVKLYKELEENVPEANKAFYAHKIAALNLKLKK